MQGNRGLDDMIPARRQPEDIELFDLTEEEFEGLPDRIQEYVIAMEEKLTVLEQQKEAGSFFRGILADHSRIARPQQVVHHLQEYHFLLNNVHLVYGHVTGGAIIKPGHYADQVIEKFEDHVATLVEQEIDNRVNAGELYRSWVTARNPKTQEIT